MLKLGVNVDHVATIRQARGTRYPDPVAAALLAEQAGADGITVHLREDRRHIQERDVERLLQMTQTKVNLEMAVTPPMLELACRWQPTDCCLVPETREELTTEGGLDIITHRDRVAAATRRLSEAGVRVSLFIDPEPEMIREAAAIGAPVVELHTGAYAEARETDRLEAWRKIRQGVELGCSLGLTVNAGHGLHYHNVTEIARIPGLTELNIGHAIVARALFDGFRLAVSEMKRLMREA
ncbi:MAG: pyridoxine 5'-phosphate synthase [Magnetococcales bacterium]|nr:pyridoxine 5'-phosphate synthase [Magnetococcales bacterium]